MGRSQSCRGLLAIAAILVCSGVAKGEEAAEASRQRPVAGMLTPFSLSDEAAFFDKGSLQIQQTLGYSHRTKEDHSFSLYDGETDLNYAVNDQLQLTFEFASYSYEDSSAGHAMKYDASGVKAIFALVNPEQHWLGVAIAQEITAGPESASADTRFIFQHFSGPWNFAYNLSIQTEVGGLDGGGNDVTGVISNTGGVAYTLDLSDKAGCPLTEVSFGFEAEIDSTYNEWQRYAGTAIFAGPTLGMAFDEHWNFTVSGFVQLTDEPETPRWQVMFLLGYQF